MARQLIALKTGAKVALSQLIVDLLLHIVRFSLGLVIGLFNCVGVIGLAGLSLLANLMSSLMAAVNCISGSGLLRVEAVG